MIEAVLRGSIVLADVQEVACVGTRQRRPERPRKALKSGRPSGQCATASPPRTILANGRGYDSGGDGGELNRPVAAVAGPQANVVAALVNDYAKAIVLELVDPLRSGGDLRALDGLAGPDEAERLAPIPSSAAAVFGWPSAPSTQNAPRACSSHWCGWGFSK
jgi:hypothetical protein